MGGGTGKKDRKNRELYAHEEEDSEEATAAADIHEELRVVRDDLRKADRELDRVQARRRSWRLAFGSKSLNIRVILSHRN
jgi:formate-dependent nitrite reductase cytochrome c552 subunit